MAALGLLPIALIVLTRHQSFFGQWFLSQVLAPDRILPLIGLGFAFGLVSLRMFFTGLFLLIVGMLGGFAVYDRVIFLLYNVWHAPSHFSITGPISCLAAGLPLLPGERLRAWLLPLAAFIAGSMLAIAVSLNDPSPGDLLFTGSPVLLVFWIITAVSLTVRTFRQNWLVIFGRILGSWTVATGVLYGGASIALAVRPALPVSAISPLPSQGTEFNSPFEGGNVFGGKAAAGPSWRTPDELDRPQP